MCSRAELTLDFMLSSRISSWCVVGSLDWLAMSSYADNEAVFKQKAKDADLTDAVVAKLSASGFKTMSKFAFSSSYVPGSGDETAFVQLINQVLGRDGTLAELSSFRKLLHECYALVTAEMKQQLERSEDVTSRKLTQPERSDLYVRQCKRLRGLSIKGHMEPSDALVDIFCGIYDANRLRFVAWDKYTSREDELERDAKKDQAFTIDSAGNLKVEAKQADVTADTSSEMLLQYALQRRGLAMDQANLLEYEVHQTWVDKLLKHRLQSSPEGYAKVTMKQLMEADKRLFHELADHTRAGVQAGPQGRPLDRVFSLCTSSADVMHLLQPLPAPKPSILDPKFTERPHPYQREFKGGKEKGKGKAKGKGGRMPLAMVEAGCRAFTNSGDPICFGYSLGSCTNKVVKGRCEKGFHVCAMPKCGKHHPFTQCPMKGEVKS